MDRNKQHFLLELSDNTSYIILADYLAYTPYLQSIYIII